MTTYDVKLLKKELVAEGTMLFHFEKPAGFDFKPGQALDVILPGSLVPDPQNARHTFSIVSAPFEDHLAVATRLRDSVFKRALKDFPVGGSAQLEGPFGSLTLHNKRARAAVFIAGGIGITPFMSMLRQAARDRLPQRLLLLYSNRRPEDAAFLAELQQLEQQNAGFRLVATMTDLAKSTRPWTGETRMIDESLLKRISTGLPEPIYYLAGPPGMVAGVRETLNRAGIDDDDIRSEEFYGY